MTEPTRLPAAPASRPAQPRCPFRWRGCCPADPPAQVDDSDADARYVQVRRQGIYLAACIIDDVAGLGMATPEAVIDEIRRRLCELVRCELQASERLR